MCWNHNLEKARETDTEDLETRLGSLALSRAAGWTSTEGILRSDNKNGQHLLSTCFVPDALLNALPALLI